MKTSINPFLIILLFLGFISCNRNGSQEVHKMSATDPFKNTITPSQFFDVDTKTSNVVEGEKGTVISMPKGCFLDEDGNEVTGQVKVELTEALSAADMVLSNLTTTSDGKILESGGMVYIHATANGKEVKINPAKPVYMEIPTKKRKAGMQLYKGTRDANGNMNWTDPKPLENYLIPIKMELLNFLPEGFEDEVKKGIPYKNHKTYTKELADSLYYSFGGGPRTEWDVERNSEKDTRKRDSSKGLTPGIDPSIIKTIHSEKYQNTLIATREFEKRLQSVFKTCNNKVIEVYIKNIDKNMWELDEMAAKIAPNKIPFSDFSKEKLTNVKYANEAAKNLSGYYEKHLNKTRIELEALYQKAKEIRNKEDARIQKLRENYQEIVVRRVKDRMPKYGFILTEDGWKNIDTGTVAKPWIYASLEVKLNNIESFDRAYAYFFVSSIHSLMKMDDEDKKIFSTSSKKLPMMKEGCIALSIAYIGNQAYFTSQDFKAQAGLKLDLTLKAVSKEELNSKLASLDTKDSINSITRDLWYQKEFYNEGKRQKELADERDFLGLLLYKAYPCCDNKSFDLSSVIFLMNCANCHKMGGGDLIGPDLFQVGARWPDKKKLRNFILHPEQYIDKDPYIMSLQKKYGNCIMATPPLTDCEIDAIMKYLNEPWI